MADHAIAEEMEAALFSIANCLSAHTWRQAPMLRPEESPEAYRRRLIEYAVDHAKAVAAQNQW
jgi:hypothetical protein